MTVTEFQALERANGGQVGMTARISVDDLLAFRDVLEDGALWFVFAKETAEIMTAGRLKTPVASQGVVDLAADGPAGIAEREGEHYLPQSQSYEDWTPADSDPHGYSVSKKIEMDVQGQRILWHPDHQAIFHGGEQTGAVFWAYAVDLTRIAFTIRKSEDDPAWEFVLHGTSTEDEGVGAKLEEIESWGLGGANPDGTEVEVSLGGYDLLRLSLRRKVDVNYDSGPGRVLVDTSVAGGVGVNEEKTVEVEAATGGTFTLTFDGETTKPVDYDATAADVQAALDELPNLYRKKTDTPDTAVTGGPLSTAPITIEFINRLAETNVGKLEADVSQRLGVALSTPKFWVRDLRVNGVAPDDEWTASDMVRDVCHRLGVSTKLVSESSVSILPADFRDATFRDVLDWCAAVTGWRWLFIQTASGIECDFGPYSKVVWFPVPGESDPELIPTRIFNRVKVAHGWIDGRVSAEAIAHANPDPYPGERRTLRVALERPGSEWLAEHVARWLVDYVSVQRFSGSHTFSQVYDANGTLVHHSYVKAGHQIYYADLGVALDIATLDREDAVSTVHYPTDIRGLVRVNALMMQSAGEAGR